MEQFSVFLMVYAAMILLQAIFVLWQCRRFNVELVGFTLHSFIVMAAASWLITWWIC